MNIKMRKTGAMRQFALAAILVLALLPVSGKAQCLWDGTMRHYNCPANVAGGIDNNGAAVKATIQGARFGEVIRLGCGNFPISGEIILAAASGGVIIEGQGKESTTLLFTSGVHGLIVDAADVTVRNLAIGRSHTDHTGPGGGIVTSNTGLVLENLLIYKFKEAVWLGGNSRSARITGCYFTGNESGIGIGATNADNLLVAGNNFFGNSMYGLFTTSTSNPSSVTITNNAIEGSGKSGILLNSGRMVTIANNYFESNEWSRIPINESHVQDAHILIQELSNPIRNIVIRENFFNGPFPDQAYRSQNVVMDPGKWNVRGTSEEGRQLRPWRFVNSSGQLIDPNVGLFWQSSSNSNYYQDYNGNGNDAFYCKVSKNCY